MLYLPLSHEMLLHESLYFFAVLEFKDFCRITGLLWTLTDPRFLTLTKQKILSHTIYLFLINFVMSLWLSHPRKNKKEPQTLAIIFVRQYSPLFSLQHHFVLTLHYHSHIARNFTLLPWLHHHILLVHLFLPLFHLGQKGKALVAIIYSLYCDYSVIAKTQKIDWHHNLSKQTPPPKIFDCSTWTSSSCF